MWVQTSHPDTATLITVCFHQLTAPLQPSDSSLGSSCLSLFPSDWPRARGALQTMMFPPSQRLSEKQINRHPRIVSQTENPLCWCQDSTNQPTFKLRVTNPKTGKRAPVIFTNPQVSKQGAEAFPQRYQFSNLCTKTTTMWDYIL